MSDDGFNTHALDVYAQQVLKISNRYLPNESKKFINREGTKLKTATLKKAKQKTNKKTGNYYKGIKKGKVYTYAGNGGTSVRVYGGKPAYHAHLIEYGHVIRNEKNGAELGFVPGKHVFEEAFREFDDKFAKDIEKFLDEVVAKL